MSSDSSMDQQEWEESESSIDEADESRANDRPAVLEGLQASETTEVYQCTACKVQRSAEDYTLSMWWN
eukprot:4362991-Karenia_brevis.AAC.1